MVEHSNLAIAFSIAAGPLHRDYPLSSIDELESVRDYLAAIGAELVEIDRAAVREMVAGYPRTVGQVRFSRTGEVTVRGKATAPTPEQAEAIAAAFKHIKLPEAITLAAIASGPPGVDLNSRGVFVCHDFDGRVAMIHERYETQHGKGFIPWTPCNDGQWRKIEPDTMPFYGLNGAQEHSTLFLHEGAKAAARVKRLLAGEETAERSPWLEELRWGAHVGWNGGTYAVHRSDWRRLANMGWKRVIIIADNDDNGLKAAHEIAGLFRANVWLCAFDGRFPLGFDLGDDWPADQYDERKRYIGPALRDCLLPATQATILIPPEDRGPPTKVLRDDYAALVAYTADPPRIIYRANPSRDMRPETFNIRVAPFSNAANTALLVWRKLSCQHERMVYRPGDPSGTINVDGSRCFNVYEGAQIAPVKNGDAKPWFAFLEHLFPDAEERPLVMKWIATLIAKPQVRMRYGMLLISATQGVGKNTLGNVLRTLVGPNNASFPSEASVVDSAFNGWAARKRLIFISEFYSGEKRKAYDKLKSLVTDDVIEVNEKGVNQYELDNAATIIACSNSEEALYLDDEDRRWLVPTVTEEKLPPAWWAELYKWLAGDGPGTVLQWAQDYVRDHGHVGTGDHAPGSARKTVIAERSRSPALKLAIELAEHLTTIEHRVILPMREVRKWIALQLGFQHADGTANIADRRLGKPEVITKGLKMVEGVTVWGDKRRPKIAGTRQAVAMNFAPEPDAEWPDIKEHLTNLEGVRLDDPM